MNFDRIHKMSISLKVEKFDEIYRKGIYIFSLVVCHNLANFNFSLIFMSLKCYRVKCANVRDVARFTQVACVACHFGISYAVPFECITPSVHSISIALKVIRKKHQANY